MVLSSTSEPIPNKKEEKHEKIINYRNNHSNHNSPHILGCSKTTNEASPKTTESAASTEKNFTFKLQHPGVEGDAYFKGALEFARLAKEYSGGSITIDVYPNGELASGSNAVQGVQMGTIDIAVESSMTEANFIPSLNVLNLPFLLSDYDQVWNVLDGDVGQELAANAESAGFKVLSYWDNGFRNVSNGKRPINSVKDIVGLKIRVPENKVFVATWEALGAIPTPMAWSEVIFFTPARYS
jgi:tripartite ATP-independent transporter DctP family solute receptor